MQVFFNRGDFMLKKKENRGGRREGAGRPRKQDKIQRKVHSIRAFDDEWELIQEFKNLVRKDKIKCNKIIKLLKRN